MPALTAAMLPQVRGATAAPGGLWAALQALWQSPGVLETCLLLVVFAPALGRGDEAARLLAEQHRLLLGDDEVGAGGGT